MKQISVRRLLFALPAVLLLLIANIHAASQSLQSGSISGTILNADGTPAIAATVAILTMENAPPPLGTGGACSVGTNPEILWLGAFSNTTITDSAGRYVLNDVVTGIYRLVVGVGMPYSAPGLRGMCRPFRILRTPTYFPGTAEMSKATAFTVNPATNVNIDFRMVQPNSDAQLFNVKGKVVFPTRVSNTSAANSLEIRVTLGTKVSMASAGPRGTFRGCPRETPWLGALGMDGAFEVRNVPPGEYTACLIIDGGDVARVVDGPKSITVEDRNVVNLTFTILF